MIACLHCHEPVTSRLVLFYGSCRVKNNGNSCENLYHVTLSRRILFLQKLNFHMYMELLMNDLKMLPMIFKHNVCLYVCWF